jgi:hypothetical protein
MDSKSALIFNPVLVFVELLANLCFFQKLKIARYIWDPCCHLVSISPTFYEQLLHQNPLAKKIQTQIVST